jgi:tetratricopeptide (TPR) repeat protein
LIRWENNFSGYEQKSVAVTFGTQLEELEHQSPNFGNLLKVLSFLDPESIPLNMITEGAESSQLQSASSSNVIAASPKQKPSLLHKFKMAWHRQRGEPTTLRDGPDNATSPPFVNVSPESLIDLLCSPVQLQRAIQHLHSRSLVGYESNGDESVLRIHDLIQLTIQESTSEDADHHWFHVAVELVCSGFRQIDDPWSYTSWAQCDVFAPHIQSLTKWDIEHSVGNSDLDDANIRIATYLRSRGRYGEAETLLVRVLAKKEKVLGPEHLDTSLVVDNLADVYRRQGRYNEAEILFRQALASREKLLGLEHTDTLRTLHGLAGVHRRQKHYKDAEPMYLRAIEGREKCQGPDHMDTLDTVEGLANLYADQGEYGKAEILYKRVLAGTEKNLGPDYPNILRTIESLSSVYVSLRRYGEAETLSMRALEGKEMSLGPDHPSTLVSIANLAGLYHSQGRYDEAEVLYRRTLTSREKVLGPEHPDTLRTVQNLATFFNQQGRYEEEILLRNRFLQAVRSQ